MKRSLFIAALTALFSTSAIAGDIEIHSKGDVTVVEGHGFEAIAEVDQLSWCYETDRETVCGGTDTKWGCQYFPEEGPADDIAVCILTTLAENCCECLSVCPDEGDEEGQSFDPALLIEVIVDALDPTESLPHCGWEPSSNSNECNLVCGGDYKARCIRTASGTVGCATTNGPYTEGGPTGSGTLPCEVPV